MHQKNNFDFLRLLCALFVITTHSFALSGFCFQCDWLYWASGEYINLSHLGLNGLFAISGYLIFQSLVRSRQLIDFYWKRVLRVFPGLFVVLLLTILLAPFVYENKSVTFLNNRWVWTYIPSNLSLYRMQLGIDGIFDDNPYKNVINGSLWTIPYEFVMYMCVSCLIFFRHNRKTMLVLLVAAFLLVLCGHLVFREKLAMYQFGILNGGFLSDIGIYFILGAILSAAKIETLKYRNLLLVISCTTWVLAIALRLPSLVYVISSSLSFVLLGLKSTPWIRDTRGKLGDLSYGIYIYGFPVQQTLEHYFSLEYLPLIICTVVIAFPLAYLSWHFIEAPMLRLKTIRLPVMRKMRALKA